MSSFFQHREGGFAPKYACCALFVVLFAFSGCKKASQALHHHSVLERVKGKAFKPVPRTFFKKKLQLTKEQRVSVEWGKPKRRFATLKRTQHIKRYPCSSCHKKGMSRKGMASARFRLTHGNIRLQHAPKGTLKCSSCHNSKHMDMLRAPSGALVSFDHSYKLCSSCHQKVAKDWAGGAHGKRLKRWYGQRVVYNCTQCHNPHTPLSRFGKRWPKAHFSLPSRKRGHK